MTIEKEVEFKGENFKVKSKVWANYVSFYVNELEQRIGPIVTRDIKTPWDFKNYAKQAVEQFIETRRAKTVLENWDGKL